MAKKNVRDEPPKTQVTENAQLSDIVFILDKMELLLQAISDIDKNGRYKTVPADKKHRNSFLKIDRYASMFENFLKNFWSQLKDPTRFGILSVKENALDNPEVRQAIEDLAAGRKSDAVEEFLKKYEIVPRSKENQSINHQNQEEMAKKTETQQQAAPETAQQPKYRYNESMINWEELKKYESEYQYCYLHIFGFDANDEAKLLGINPASVRMKRTRIYQEVQLKHNKETFLRDYIIKNLLK